MAVCTLTLDIGYGADTPFDGQSIMVGRYYPADVGELWVTTTREEIELTASPFATVSVEQDAYYWVREVDRSLHVKQVPATATANYSDLADVDPASLSPFTPPSPAWLAALAAEEAARIAADALKADQLGIAAGTPLRAYGHSGLVGGIGTAVSNYFSRARRRLQAKTWFNYGVASSRAADACSFAYGTVTLSRQGTGADEENVSTAAGTWTPAAFVGGVTIVDVVGNDAHWDGYTGSGGTTAKSRAGFTNGLDALIRMLRAESYIEDNNAAITYAPAWSGATRTSCTGARISFTSTPTQTATFTARNGDALVLLSYDAAGSGFTGSTYTLTYDGGTAYTSGTTNDLHRKTGAVLNNGFGQMAIPIEGLTAGDHTFVLTHTGSAGHILAVDCILRESPTPQTIVVMKKFYIEPAGYAAIVGAGGIGASEATDDIYNALVDTVVARFPDDGSIAVIDPNALGWDAATMVTTIDNLHANDVGMQFLAAAVVDTINDLPARNGLVRTNS